MLSGHLFHSRKHSWPADEYVNRNTLQLLDFDGGAPPRQAWRRRLNSHANKLKEFSVTFMEAMRMLSLGLRLWSYVREEASHGRKAPIDPFTRESCKPSASQGVPLGGMGSGSISRGFRGEFKHWHILPGQCEMSPIMANQFSGRVCVTASDMWTTMVQDGHFGQENFNSGPSRPSLTGDTHCAAVSASTWVEPHGRCIVVFSVAWSSPKVKFQKGDVYHRRYTKFYGTFERSAVDLGHNALTKYKWWEEEIEKWQNPILKDEKLPEWLT